MPSEWQRRPYEPKLRKQKKTMIRLEQIHKTYNNGSPLHVLKGIDLDSLTLEQAIKQALKKMVKG